MREKLANQICKIETQDGAICDWQFGVDSDKKRADAREGRDGAGGRLGLRLGEPHSSSSLMSRGKCRQQDFIRHLRGEQTRESTHPKMQHNRSDSLSSLFCQEIRKGAATQGL